MPDYDFSLVEAYLIDPQLNTMRVFRDVLMRLGIKKIQNFSGLTGVAAAIEAAAPDLVIADADTADSDVFRLFRAIRADPAASNPFIGMIVTTWQPTKALLAKVSNCGADDLLVKPASPRQVMDRIHALIEARKKFVVTADYIGPDRRKSSRDGAQIPLLDVPNTLKLKVTGQWSKVDSRDLITIASAKLSEMKLVRGSIQSAFLIEFAIPGLAHDPPEKIARDHLDRVPGVLDDIKRRLAISEPGQKTEIAAKGLLAIVEQVRKQAESAPVGQDELGQLRSLAHGLVRAISPNRAPDALAKEVTDAVEAYRNRLAELLAAKAAAAAHAAGTQGAGSSETAAATASPGS
ncbi:MAG: response regulator [Azospirillum sp.]|nr:response regulator [Azospirillum sp.]